MAVGFEDQADGLELLAGIGTPVQGLQLGSGNEQHNTFNLVGREVSWPITIGRPPLAADGYVERTVDLPATTGTPTYVLVGDGGTGKTQIAASIFQRTIANDDTDLAIWTEATTRAGVLASFGQAWARVDPSAPTTTDDLEQLCAGFLGWLSSTGRRWLIVLDDIADPAVLTRLWPAGRNGTVVATTRRRDSGILTRDRIAVDVGVFTPEESVAYLNTKLGALDEAPELAADLGHLPLALAQAAAVIHNDAISGTAYRRMFADRSRTLAELFPHDLGDDYPYALATTWDMALARADALPPQGLAGRALNLAAVLDPNGMPAGVFKTAPALAYLANEPGKLTEDDAHRAIRNLHRLSLVSHDPHSAELGVRVHSLVQRATVERLGPADTGQAALTAVAALREVWEPALDEALRANATALLTGHGPAVLAEGGTHELARRTGESYGRVGLMREAIELFGSVAAAATGSLGPDHPAVQGMRHLRAHWRGRAGDLGGAIADFTALVADRRRVLGADDRATLGARHALARWRVQAGDPAGMIGELTALLADQRRALGADDDDVWLTRYAVALARLYAGDTSTVLAELNAILRHRIRVLGADHADTLTVRASIAAARIRTGNRDRAVIDLEALVADQIRVLGPHHQGVYTAKLKLITLKSRRIGPRPTLGQLEELVAETQATIGPDNPVTLTARHHVAYFQRDVGELATAVQSFIALLDDRTRVFGASHPATIDTRRELATCRQRSGDYTRASADFAEVLRLQTEQLGPDHPDVLRTRNTLGTLQFQQEDLLGAYASLRALLDDQLRILGPDDRDLLKTRAALAGIRGHLGDAESAVAELESTLAAQIRVLGNRHHQTARTRERLAQWRKRIADSRAEA